MAKFCESLFDGGLGMLDLVEYYQASHMVVGNEWILGMR